MKSRIFIAFLAAITIGTTTAHADGITTTNKGATHDPHATVVVHATLKADPTTQTNVNAMGGSNIGGSDRASDWASSAQADLQDAQASADADIVTGNWMDARKNLLDGLANALGDGNLSPADLQESLTYRILTRGQDLAEAIGDAIQNDPNLIIIEVRALESYYDFAQKTSKELDIPLYIPMHASQALPSDPIAYENLYQSYAQDQLNWLLKSFVRVATVPGGNEEIYSKIPEKAFLTLAEFVTKDVAVDLQDSLFGNRYACASKSLQKINEKLARYNQGDHSAYMNDRFAINIAVPQIRKDATSIQRACQN